MLHSLISFFGFAKVSPKWMPKRPPTARKKPVVKAEPVNPGMDTTLRDAERLRYEEDQILRAARAVSTIGAAADVYARHVGQVGSKPSPAHLARARDVLGNRRWAYFQALALAGRKIPMIPVPMIGNPGHEDGFADGIDRDLNANLDLWASIRALEAKAADLARRLNKPIPTPIAIPADIQKRLLERDRLRADRGGDGRGRRRPDPDPVPEVEPEAPLPTPEPETGGKGSIRGAKGRDEEQDGETLPPSQEDAEKPNTDDDDDDPKGPGKP